MQTLKIPSAVRLWGSATDITCELALIRNGTCEHDQLDPMLEQYTFIDSGNTSIGASRAHADTHFICQISLNRMCLKSLQTLLSCCCSWHSDQLETSDIAPASAAEVLHLAAVAPLTRCPTAILRFQECLEVDVKTEEADQSLRPWPHLGSWPVRCASLCTNMICWLGKWTWMFGGSIVLQVMSSDDAGAWIFQNGNWEPLLMQR